MELLHGGIAFLCFPLVGSYFLELVFLGSFSANWYSVLVESKVVYLS